MSYWTLADSEPANLPFVIFIRLHGSEANGEWKFDYRTKRARLESTLHSEERDNEKIAQIKAI